MLAIEEIRLFNILHIFPFFIINIGTYHSIIALNLDIQITNIA